MRYRPEHKIETHQKIVKDASQRLRAKGVNGAAVAAVMRDAGLTHGGFYKHFASKDELLLESLKEGFREIIATLVCAAEQSPPGEAWKAIVKAYLRPEMCEYPEHRLPPGDTCAGIGTRRQEDEASDRSRASELQEPNGAVYAWPPNHGQRTGILCDLFNDDGSD